MSFDDVRTWWPAECQYWLALLCPLEALDRVILDRRFPDTYGRKVVYFS